MSIDLVALAAAPLTIFARVAAMLAMLPLFGDESISVRVRLLIAFALAVALSGLLAPRLPAQLDADQLALLAVSESLIGLALGLIVRIFYSAIHVAGAIVSTQIGLTSILIPDPGTGGMSSGLGKLLSMAALIACLAAGLHHWWIASLIESYRLFPPGGWPEAATFAALAVRAAGGAMALGVALSAPFLVYALLYNLALGLASRLAPTIQIYFIAQPLNLLLGIALLLLTAATMIDHFSGAMVDFMRRGWAP